MQIRLALCAVAPCAVVLSIAGMVLGIEPADAKPAAKKPSNASANIVYTKLFDAPGCMEQKGPEEGSEKQLYECPGPIPGVLTQLLTGSDWDHVYLLIDGQKYSLWGPMTKVGSWSGVSNPKGLVEWGFAAGKPKTRANLNSFIIRFSGTQIADDGMTQKQRSQLSVFGLQKGRICWRGNAADNAQARAFARSAICKEVVQPE